MQDRDLYSKLLGLSSPWVVTDVELKMSERAVNVMVGHDPGVGLRCPVCGQEAPRYDGRVRRWRHLDTMQYQTFLVADVPRTKCEVDGVHQVAVPWAEPNSRFTALFEILAIDWLREASITAVARLLGLSWDEVAGIQGRAVERGIARRAIHPVQVLGIDETSFQRRHEYVTVVVDQARGNVLHVLDGRGKKEVADFFGAMTDSWRGGVRVVAMDMWEPYISAVSEQLPTARVAFDRFHIAKHLNEAVDKVRRQEHRELQSAGNTVLNRTKYFWLQNPENMKPSRRAEFGPLRDSSLRVARAWALKETARHLWNYQRRAWAEKAWKRWLGWAQRCRLAPLVRVGRMIRAHFDGVMTAAVTSITSAKNEAINARIQWMKRLACGYRNRERFKRAIYFHVGGLDLYPRVNL